MIYALCIVGGVIVGVVLIVALLSWAAGQAVMRGLGW